MAHEMKVVEIGNEFIFLNQITHVHWRISDNLFARGDGTYYEVTGSKDEGSVRGLVLTVHFVSGSEHGDYIRLYMKEADEMWMILRKMIRANKSTD